MTMHGQNAHLGNINPYLLAQQQQQQQHNSLLTGPNQLGHQGSHDNRSGGHQVSFAGSQQPKREGKGGNSYQSYWSGGR